MTRFIPEKAENRRRFIESSAAPLCNAETSGSLKKDIARHIGILLTDLSRGREAGELFMLSAQRGMFLENARRSTP